MKLPFGLRSVQALLLFLALGVVASAQNPASFFGARAYLGNFAAVGDFTHDGILDLVTIDQETSAIHLHAGMGNGTFAGDKIIDLTTSGAGAANFLMRSADLNGDGFADLIVGVRSSTNELLIQTLLGNAASGFVHGETFTPKTGFENFYLADMNGDGKPDLVLVGSSSAGVQIGNGDGTFQPEIQAFSQRIPDASLAIGDFNGDGKPDLAIPVANGIFILFGDGTGRFPTGTTFTTTEEFGPITAADVNGDGKQDLIVETYMKGLLEVLFGNGDGSFGVAQVYFIGPGSGNQASGLAVGDVNGDGILDIVTPDPAVLLGKGDGTFGTPVQYPSNYNWQSLQLADLRAIGRLDIVGDVSFIGGYISDTNTTVLLNAGGGKFQDGENVLLNSTASNCLTVADFNRDGRDDVAVGLLTGVEILLGTGQSKAALKPASLLSFPNAQTACPISGDFNNDGITDLLVGEGSGTLAYLAGRGDGTFGTPVLTQQHLFSLVAGDFNGDGKLDVAGLSNFSAISIDVLVGNGAGGFALTTAIPQKVLPNSLVGGDLNGDGLPDLVATTDAAQNGMNQITVYLNQGGGTFQPHVYALPGAPLYAYYSVIADLNNDGIPDLVVVGFPSSYVLLGLGAGAFGAPTLLTTSGTIGVVADINGDGVADLAAIDGYTVKVLLGSGTGTFSSPGNPDGLWFAPPGPGGVAAAYLQSQSQSSGLADLVTLGGSPSGSYLSVLLNQAVPAPK